MPLLGPDDPPPFAVRNPDANSDIVLVSDHSGIAVPAALDGLGVFPSEMRRHVAYDIGIADVGHCLANRLDATLIESNYSRLVIDCNRYPGAVDSIPGVSDHTVVPANAAADAAERDAREREVFHPYHQEISLRLSALRAANRSPVLVSLHSYTPVMEGLFRPWDIGILWRDDSTLARPLVDALSMHDEFTVGENLPYSGRGHRAYTMVRHTRGTDMLHVSVEFRQDRIEFRAGAERWAEIFGDALLAALAHLPAQQRRVA